MLRILDSDLLALRLRVRQTRWPAPWPSSALSPGISQDEVRRLAAYWADGYDWRAQEAAINALPSHTVSIAGADVHYLRYDGEGPAPFPLVLTNGWPSSFLELTGLAQRLATPSAFGGRAEDAFTVIVPSIPGFGFSAQQPTLLASAPAHEIWHKLMHTELGFARYGAQGGDLGAGYTSRLGQEYPSEVAGIHLMALADPPSYDPASLTDEERQYLDEADRWMRSEGGYEHEQRTRPLTLSYGLSDSPVGLLAWLLEKYRAWADPAGRLDDDFVLTQASLYWFTNTISTSFRPYFEYGRNLGRAIIRVEVPTAVAVFPYDLAHPPRSWAERVYHVTRYTRMQRGGHFAPYEVPELLAADLTAFFRDLRP